MTPPETPEERAAMQQWIASESYQRAKERARARINQTEEHQMTVREPDIYTPDGETSFFADLYNSRAHGDQAAGERIQRHQRYEGAKTATKAGVEERATTSATMGGLIPPAYLLELYGKASRNGRVYADNCNNSTLPDTGMSVILPRITTATAAGTQATENTTVTTQDPAETDLTVNVRTIAGYLPVSRQALERSAYNDRILFEDLSARVFAQIDTQCLNGAGSAGTMLGVLQTAGIATSTASTATVAGVWPKIADVIQQINSNMGGLGYTPDKIFMHPRRWGWFAAAVDTTGRPLVSPTAADSMNPLATGESAGLWVGWSAAGPPRFHRCKHSHKHGRRHEPGLDHHPLLAGRSPVREGWRSCYFELRAAERVGSSSEPDLLFVLRFFGGPLPGRLRRGHRKRTCTARVLR
jgi:HK97 family phage major capsid protein